MNDHGAGDETLVDARGLACPLPVIRLAEAVQQRSAGSRVRLLSDDPASRVDVPVWCRMQRHRLVEVTDEPTGGVAFLVERR